MLENRELKNSMHHSAISDDTICALSTANGMGAIALIRVSGKDAISLVSKVFSKPLEETKTHTAHFGVLKNEKGELLDEVLATVFQGTKSFTGEPTVEIACHGSVFIQKEILNLFLRNGCRLANPGEFTMRAYFNGKMDLSQAEAIADLIAADSKKVHEIAMNQMRGGYSDNIGELRQKLTDFASLIELELDFSEEDVEFASRTELNDLIIELKKRLTHLVESFSYGNALKNGVKTVIAGRPNAGKSTLLNALLNDERAIVSEIEGTTRDTIEEDLFIAGVKFKFIDTAGIREAVDEIEKIGVQRTMNEMKKSSFVIYLFDAEKLPAADVLSDLNEFSIPSEKLIVVANKVDKQIDSNLKQHLKQYSLLEISAKEKIGLDSLKNELAKKVTQEHQESDTIVVNARHHEAFSNALKDLIKVEEGLEMQIPGDLLAMDIRSAIRNLASITGEITTDDLLGNIFANFCIGK
jgi:tRNA modification GTPase